MTREKIKATIIELCTENLGWADGRLERGMDESWRDLGANSLDEVELIMFLEEKLNMQIPDETWERCKTPNQTISLIDELIN